ncbi:MAG: hypothetical protein A3B91_01405 [Candidatus Yanofskybacteria bacterium RIFCSPHIGHO2_02_FULL_41_29]|uniref:Uncharacterized protein n=1 Tax=Candidatus Yanofskybacteria bacterium RIFCSPHIGHO2_01_FULL_41_53 TaxID=1802663 RepID=A0A1F8EKB9_9BACT|nr:MAG: hypothetical protein A2650_04690 [Candidatus Yanofskybacteria bacterium RIFCSPHIGHO2_01_FULL_41_53]OGN12433.1 MAG: hypothetical protein A3B91_01405 [Candidatus Yanofskybacteria bacterium RIFCSPHIGHO2_02_FULL_41_29]OGN18679.1 MAG: hypothetical protein A3F48_02535 [Candidatus Yanofskybacteria bacterium RIFCSPHIGHO2_12_FULL_41_9]OGN24412.1 MAG: hypothetical protein A2916_04220 [Candidatus Yanofskybacteria bacterium RIFCSPLOWO2_01_FULL_41_67]OGN28645.1 MAG: hypothetical protein A3H54_01055 
MTSRIKAELTQEQELRLDYSDGIRKPKGTRRQSSIGLSFSQWLRSLTDGQLINEFQEEIYSKSNSVSARERVAMFRIELTERMRHN